MILVDSNVPMYIVGGDHPNKHRTRDILIRLAAEGEVLVTDAEVLQEILHRFVAIRRLDAIEPAMEAILGQVAQVFPIERADVLLATEVVRTAPLSARDALHVAVMRRRGIDRIMSFDRVFDAVPGLERIGD